MDISANFLSSSILCTTTGGPATEITWKRNGVEIMSNSTNYFFIQIITNTEGAMYENVLEVQSSELFNGLFSCTASNIHGNSTQCIEGN